MKIYEPSVEDATAHTHVDWKTHESTGRFAPYSRALCSTCPPMTREEDEEECRKYAAYEKRVILENATRRPSKSLHRRMYRHRILIAVGLLIAVGVVVHFLLR